MGVPKVDLTKALATGGGTGGPGDYQEVGPWQMKIVDVNVLLYVVNHDAPQHEQRANMVGGCDYRVGTDRHSLDCDFGFSSARRLDLAFIDRRFGQAQAIAKVADLASLAEYLHSSAKVESHWHIPSTLLDESFGTAGNLANDAHLAAIAIGYGATLVSCDADFSRL